MIFNGIHLFSRNEDFGKTHQKKRISCFALVFLQTLEPVMHFEEVRDYRVGQVVLHSTQ